MHPEVKERIAELVAQGQLQKACSALCAKPPVQVTAEVIREMKRKHPSERAPINWDGLRSIHASAVEEISEGVVEKMIGSFAKGSAGGPSGLKPQHLKDALQFAYRDELIHILADVVTKLARGDAPTRIRPFLNGAALIALPKPSGDLRPIAVGEVLRRLVSKCMLDSCSDEAKARLEPLQVGVGTRQGAEATVHVARQWMDRHNGDPHRVLVKLDMENAFNTMDREAMLLAVRSAFPQLAPWVDFSYGARTGLWLDGRRLDSCRGVRQGDPLGPLLFALALQLAIEKVKA